MPPNDCLCAVQATIPHRIGSSLQRCLQRQGISRLPDVEGEASPKRKPIGLFRIDLARVRTAKGKLDMLVAIVRTTDFAFVELHGRAKPRSACDFLRHLADAGPSRIHTALTDNGIRFRTRGAGGSAASPIAGAIACSDPFWAHAIE